MKHLGRASATPGFKHFRTVRNTPPRLKLAGWLGGLVAGWWVGWLGWLGWLAGYFVAGYFVAGMEYWFRLFYISLAIQNQRNLGQTNTDNA